VILESMKNLVVLAITATLASSLTLAQAPKPSSTLTLTLTTSEPIIKKGKLGLEVIKKTYVLDAQAVQRSKQFTKISSKLAPKLEAIFQGLAREAKNARFVNENGTWVARQRSAWRVDETKTRANILKAIMAGQSSAAITLKVTPPKRTVRQWADAGIVALYGKGSSSFAGSPSFRVQNVIAGALKFDGDYIESGKELDFNASVGKINRANGFVPGLVIIGGTLLMEDGGGICQVSTTLFRAAYNAGLPITKRHQHSHRVQYYDPVGFEATVYAPSKNLKFKNDSGSPIFIQADWSERAGTLAFYFFGRAPDRQVTISKPSISNFRSPAPPSFSPDPSVRLGLSRQIDVPMQGMTSLITRRVKLSTGEVRKDTLRSVYQPWGAVYAVNPRDPRLQ
jgi:vancomycin resistance protein YoaR